MRSGNNELIIRKLPAAVFLLLAVQPLLDIAGYWQSYFGISSLPTLAVRMALFGGTILAGFRLSEKRRWYIGMGCVFVLHTALHCLACLCRPGGYAAPLTDILNLVRIWYLPVMTVCFITFLKRNSCVLPAMAKGFLAALLEIAAVMTISVVTATNPYTYSMYYIGVLGWFLWTNSQSAILSMLCPIAIIYTAYRRPGKVLPVIFVTAIAEAALYYLGPRLAFASIVADGLAVAFAFILTGWSRKKAATAAVVCITLLFAAAYPLSPANERAGYVYMGYYKEWVAQHEAMEQQATEQAAAEAAAEAETGDEVPAGQGSSASDGKMATEEAGSGNAAEAGQDASAATGTGETAAGTPADAVPGNETLATDTAGGEETSTAPAADAEPEMTEEAREAYLDYLEELYRSRHLMWSLVERFGREKVFEAFDYTEDLEEISNVRRIKITYCSLLMEEAGLPSRLFGLSLQDMTFLRYDVNYEPVIDNYDVENDFHGLYFLTGITGLILMLVFLSYFPFKALAKIIRRSKKYFTLPMAAFGIAFGMAMIHAFFAASILRHNNASVYLAVILAALWKLSQEQEAAS